MEELKKAPLKAKRLPKGISLDIYSYLQTKEIVYKIGALSKKDRESCINSHLLGERTLCFNMLHKDLGETPAIPQFFIDLCTGFTLKFMLNKEQTQNLDSYFAENVLKTIDILLQYLSKQILNKNS